MEHKIETAKARIAEFCTGKRVLCAFSGGKDSQTCYQLLKETGVPFVAQYSITRLDPPELLDFIRTNYPDVTFRRDYATSLVAEIKYRGLPNRWNRWCCASKHLASKDFDISVVGIRAAESPRRRDTWRMFGRKTDGTHYICPIIDWTAEDVWTFLRSRNVPHCRLYDEGMSRIGCACCPLAPNHIREQAERWPRIANALRIGFERHWRSVVRRGGVTRRGKRFKMLDDFKSSSDAFEYWLSHGSVVKLAADEESPCAFAGTGYSESDTIHDDDAWLEIS